MAVQAPGEDNILQEVGRLQVAVEDNQLVHKLELQLRMLGVVVHSILVLVGLPASTWSCLQSWLVSADHSKFECKTTY
jgi:hypothetical protein